MKVGSWERVTERHMVTIDLLVSSCECSGEFVRGLREDNITI